MADNCQRRMLTVVAWVCLEEAFLGLADVRGVEMESRAFFLSGRMERRYYRDLGEGTSWGAWFILQ